MPQKGQKTVTLPERVYERAKLRAKVLGKSVAGWITEIILKNVEE